MPTVLATASIFLSGPYSKFWFEPKYGEKKRNCKRFHEGKILIENCYVVRKVIV
jgi:hypothetical protein